MLLVGSNALSISNGSIATIDTITCAISGKSNPAVAAIDGSRALIAYGEQYRASGKLVVASVSGTTITLGTPLSVGGGDRVGCAKLTAPYMAALKESDLKIVSISGTTITSVTNGSFGAGSVIGSDGSTTVVGLYGNGSDVDKPYVVAATYSGGTLTVGTAVRVHTVTGIQPLSVEFISSGKYLVVYRVGGTVYYQIITVSGTTVTYGTVTSDNQDFNNSDGDAAVISSTSAVFRGSSGGSAVKERYLVLDTGASTVTLSSVVTSGLGSYQFYSGAVNALAYRSGVYAWLAYDSTANRLLAGAVGIGYRTPDLVITTSTPYQVSMAAMDAQTYIGVYADRSDSDKPKAVIIKVAGW